MELNFYSVQLEMEDITSDCTGGSWVIIRVLLSDKERQENKNLSDMI